MKTDIKTKILSSWCAASPDVAEKIFPMLVTARNDLRQEDAVWEEI